MIEEFSRLLHDNGTLIGTLGGAFIGAVAAVSTTFLTRRSEERKHIKGLLVTAAVESWKAEVDANIRVKGAFVGAPVEHYILNFSKIYDRILSRNLSARDIAKELVNIYDGSDSIIGAANAKKRAD